VKRLLNRPVLLMIAVLALAIGAGVMATRAFAASETYCNSCTLPANGVPAVSTSRSTWTGNSMSTNYYDDEEIFSYSSSGVKSCDLAQNSVNALNVGCHPSVNPATQRCHVIHLTGPDVGVCRGSY
jgi:hypothetical protein